MTTTLPPARPAEPAGPAAQPAGATTEPAGDTARAVGPPDAPERLLRIQEVAAETGLTPRSIRYYEELGLLRPAARSVGDYRLYDTSDLERLRMIRALRDDAGLSLADIGTVLEDEESRRRARAALQVTDDPVERRAILLGRIASVERLRERLRAKLARLQAMVDDVDARRGRLQDLLETVEQQLAGPDAAAHPRTSARSEARR